MANSLGAALGPVGGLAACACCLLLAAIWGLFGTMIALAVYTKKWKTAIKQAGGIGDSGASEILLSHSLLIGILLVYGYFALRRAIRSA